MDLLSRDEFYAACAALGIARDPEYPHSRVPRFGAGDVSRFWQNPDPPQVDAYVDSLLAALGEGGPTLLFAAGGWTGPEGYGADEWNDAVLSGGIPVGYRGAVRCSAAESEIVRRLLVTLCATNPGVAGDLLVVPEHAGAFLYGEHHDVVWVHTPGEAEMDQFVTHMQRAGFPLPDELPDETFKPVSWMG